MHSQQYDAYHRLTQLSASCAESLLSTLPALKGAPIKLSARPEPGDLSKIWACQLQLTEAEGSWVQVLAGALQDNKRAVIVGEPTFGKGLIQTIVEMSDGSAVVATAARYRVSCQLSWRELAWHVSACLRCSCDPRSLPCQLLQAASSFVVEMRLPWA